MRMRFVLMALLCVGLVGCATSSGDLKCSKAGPQSPRDIGEKAGSNPVTFDFAPDTTKMNLCNIHFHEAAEHKASGYSRLTGEGDHQGWACGDADGPTGERHSGVGPGCKGIALGDTVEVHWVYTSCDTGPGSGLGNCVSCPEEGRTLRVEGRVFRLTEDGADFADFDYDEGSSPAQPKALPAATELVQYLGSTTGPSFNSKICSRFTSGGA